MADFAGLLQRFTGKRLQSPYRSTVPLLDLVEHHRPRWESLLQACGAQGSETVHFEYCVASPKKGGNPSQTDAMVFANGMVLAIETKWTEPADKQSVVKRIERGETDGTDSRETIAGWLAHMRAFATKELQVDDFANVIYQNIHRASSACAEATKRGCRPEVAYLHFRSSHLPKSAATAEKYICDLRELRHLADPPELGFRVVDMPVEPTPSFDAIKDLDRRSPATSALVREALYQRPLFSFGEPRVTRI